MINTVLHALPSGADRVLLSIGGAIGAAFSFAFGNVVPLVIWLAIFVTGDMITGMLSAVRTKSWDGSRLFWGVIRKVAMFCIIALAHGLDEALSDILRFQFVQSVVIVAYTAGEFGSIIKNLEKAGLGGIVPPVLRYILYAVNQYLDEKVAKSLPIKLTGEKKNGES